MDSIGEKSYAKAIEGVLKTLETMFFAMPVPEEIVDKYNFLKESRYKTAGITFTPVISAKSPSSQSMASKKPSLTESTLKVASDLEDSFSALTNGYQALFDSIFGHLIERINHLTELIIDPKRSPYGIVVKRVT